MVDSPNRCRSCRGPIGDDDASDRCQGCASSIRDDATTPPMVPPQFWETTDLRAALRSRHMGKVIRAYRRHPYHGYGGLSQSEVASWAGISQGQVSRIETGPPLLRLDQLIYWSLLLGIPQEHLWFDLPDRDHPETWPRRRTARRGPRGRTSTASRHAKTSPSQSFR